MLAFKKVLRIFLLAAFLDMRPFFSLRETLKTSSLHSLCLQLDLITFGNLLFKSLIFFCLTDNRAAVEKLENIFSAAVLDMRLG